MVKATCLIDGCHAEKIIALGMCNKHYRADLLSRNPRCSIDKCEKNIHARGMCNEHYSYWKRYGDPLTPRRSFETPEESFAARTEWQGECLIWTGAKRNKGYGQLGINNEVVMAHRYAWEREHGPVPEGFLIDHKCWNPSCVNIEHLRLATKSQNAQNLSGLVSRNTSGVRNVSWHAGAWRVIVGKDGKQHNFGRYKCIKEAEKVAEQARRQLFGEYAGRG